MHDHVIDIVADNDMRCIEMSADGFDPGIQDRMISRQLQLCGF
jgi:hypothetical protein